MTEDPRRLVMHAAVAAGGASAALMSAGIVGTDDEVKAATGQCLEPILRAALHLIDAAGVLPGELERARLKLAIEDYIDAPEPVAGRCRVCGCTETAACVSAVPAGAFGGRNCAWADTTRTICDNPACLAAVSGDLAS